MKWKLVQLNCRPLPLPQIPKRLDYLEMLEGGKQRHDCQSDVKKLGKYFFTFRDHLTAEQGEMSYSSVLPTSTLLMVKEAIPSRNGCPYSVFLRSGVTRGLCAFFFSFAHFGPELCIFSTPETCWDVELWEKQQQDLVSPSTSGRHGGCFWTWSTFLEIDINSCFIFLLLTIKERRTENPPLPNALARASAVCGQRQPTGSDSSYGPLGTPWEIPLGIGHLRACSARVLQPLVYWSFAVNKSPRLVAEAKLFISLKDDKLYHMESQNWRWCFLIVGGEDHEY